MTSASVSSHKYRQERAEKPRFGSIERIVDSVSAGHQDIGVLTTFVAARQDALEFDPSIVGRELPVHLA